MTKKLTGEEKAQRKEKQRQMTEGAAEEANSEWAAFVTPLISSIGHPTPYDPKFCEAVSIGVYKKTINNWCDEFPGWTTSPPGRAPPGRVRTGRGATAPPDVAGRAAEDRPDRLVIKDAIKMGAALVTTADSAKTYLRQWRKVGQHPEPGLVARD